MGNNNDHIEKMSDKQFNKLMAEIDIEYKALCQEIDFKKLDIDLSKYEYLLEEIEKLEMPDIDFDL